MSTISLVISDVDGTLVTTDKVLTDRNRDAVARLDAAGIAFSIVSARPPFGMRMLIEPLRLRLPIGAYNGGALVMPDLTVLEQRLLSPEVVRAAITDLRAAAVDIWMFVGDRWLLENPAGANVDREERTIQTPPTVVARLEDHLDAVAKIVGVSDDFARLSACEPVVRGTLGAGATVMRSQAYYLDITPAGTDKGVTVAGLVQRLGIPAENIVTIGDMDNDLAMFRQSGFSIAMGNASPDVKRLAHAVTASNDEDGFAAAVDQLILPRARAGNAKPV
jgi:Cof subfamily protein (haloacid dehalogenase superfamily)